MLVELIKIPVPVLSWLLDQVPILNRWRNRCTVMEASRNVLAARETLLCAANHKCTGPRNNGTILPIPCHKFKVKSNKRKQANYYNHYCATYSFNSSSLCLTGNSLYSCELQSIRKHWSNGKFSSSDCTNINIVLYDR